MALADTLETAVQGVLGAQAAQDWTGRVVMRSGRRWEVVSDADGRMVVRDVAGRRTTWDRLGFLSRKLTII